MKAQNSVNEKTHTIHIDTHTKIIERITMNTSSITPQTCTVRLNLQGWTASKRALHARFIELIGQTSLVHLQKGGGKL